MNAAMRPWASLLRNPITGIADCCARRERPRNGGTAYKRDELASPHVEHGASFPSWRA